mgnify:CR=1 FL=1
MTYSVTANGADTQLTASLNRLIHLVLADFTDLIGAGLVTNYGDASGSLSATHKVAKIDYSADAMTAPTEGAAIASATAISSSNATIAVARQALYREVSDLIQGTGSVLNIEDIANAMALSAVMRRTDMVTALFPSLSQSVGTSTVDMTTDDFWDAVFQLEQSLVPLPYASVLYTVQYTDLQSSIRGEGGPAQYQAATQDQLMAKGPGYKGQFHGVDIYASDSVGQSGGNSQGAMFGAGCFGYREMSAGQLGNIPGLDMRSVDPTSPIWVEFDRVGVNGETQVVGNYYFGVSEIEDLRGVQILTDR